MISIIICSRLRKCPVVFEEHIHATIGDVPYEIIWIDNSQNDRNMCQAYNFGVTQAKYDYLCFMHEDIVFHSNDWGKMAIDSINDPSIGMLGVQGCVYYCESTTYWTKSYFRKAHIIQDRNGKKEKVYEQDYPCGNEVVAIDGLWMFIKRACFDKGLRWDDNHFRNFHMYDMDMSMQIIHHGYRIKLLEDLWIEHLSWGNFNKDFYEDNIIFHEKWDKFLPVATIKVTDEVKILSQKAAFKEICRVGKECALSKKRLLMWPYRLATKVSLLLKKDIWS